LSLLKVAYEKNRLHHLALLVSVVHGLRVSELLALTVDDLHEATISIRPSKRSKSAKQQSAKRVQASIEPLYRSANPLLDESQLAAHAHGVRQLAGKRLFPFCRQYADKIIRRYGAEAGIAAAKCHLHSLRHTTAMLCWSQSHSLGQITACLRHKSGAASIVYLHEVDRQKSQASLTAALNALANVRPSESCWCNVSVRK